MAEYTLWERGVAGSSPVIPTAVNNKGEMVMNVTMQKDKLMAILEKNREEHIKLYNEAVEKYHEVVRVKLKAVTKHFDKTKELDISDLHIEVPRSFEDQYTEAIEMLKHTTLAEIELSQSEFRQYVMDKWSWMNQFAASNARYLSGASSATLATKLR